MASVESNGKIGGIGTLLMLLTSILSIFSLIGLFYPSMPPAIALFSLFFPVLGLVGFILFVIAMKGLADAYGQPSIFNNTLYAMATAIIGVVIAVAISVAAVFFALANTIQPFNPPSAMPTFQEMLQTYFLYLIPAFAAGFIVALIASLFFKKAFDDLAEKSKVTRFRTVGRLYLVAVAVSAILLFIGFALASANLIPAFDMYAVPSFGSVLTWAIFFLATRAFFSLKASPTVEASQFNLQQ